MRRRGDACKGLFTIATDVDGYLSTCTDSLGPASRAHKQIKGRGRACNFKLC